jgi:two-component system, sensor histidine kinase and response regulator
MLQRSMTDLSMNRDTPPENLGGAGSGQAPATGQKAAPLIRTDAVSAAAPVKILIVDDTPGKLLAHEVVLTELGETVLKVSSGREALELLLKEDIAVILLDVNMPEMDGFETAALIRQRPKYEHTPIIFVTAYNTTEIDRLKGYNIGAADYLFLPVIPGVLKAKVRVFVDLARQRQIIEKQAQALAAQNEQQESQIQTIQDLNERLKAANEELEAFSYSISHDLRSPLRAMQGYAHALEEDYRDKLDAQAAEYLRRISKAATRMDILIQEVLTYSRLAKVDIQIGSVNLDTLLQEIIRDSRSLHQSKARVSVQSPLHTVAGHAACLTQCLANLLENSAKFVPPGKIPEISIRSEWRPPWVRVWVEDNGIGIDPSHHARIFQMFSRVHSSASPYEGTGMGLTIAKKAVERMGGNLGVESSLGMGSRFWIELPLGKP